MEGANWFGWNDLFSSLFPDNSWCPCSSQPSMALCLCSPIFPCSLFVRRRAMVTFSFSKYVPPFLLQSPSPPQKRLFYSFSFFSFPRQKNIFLFQIFSSFSFSVFLLLLKKHIFLLQISSSFNFFVFFSSKKNIFLSFSFSVFFSFAKNIFAFSKCIPPFPFLLFSSSINKYIFLLQIFSYSCPKKYFPFPYICLLFLLFRMSTHSFSKRYFPPFPLWFCSPPQKIHIFLLQIFNCQIFLCRPQMSTFVC